MSNQSLFNSEKKFSGKKKGQMEIMGLVVIVILITLGLLFLVYFSAKGEIEKKVFTRKGLALSTMSALMKTTVNPELQCTTSIGNDQPQLGEDILEDCAEYYQDYFEGARGSGSSGSSGGSSSGSSGTSGSGASSSAYLSEGLVNPDAMSLYHCQEKHSCKFFQETTEKLLEDTLGKWGKRYEFRAHLLSGNSFAAEKLFLFKDKSRQGCKGERDSSGQFPIQVKDIGVVEAELYVCE
ncbi:hypothetical protein HYU21_02000 [Candidatus Woesearchaeota archaeon]|nr:hypothetical protein [Candidatus Woesearchaeota archaeon]